MLRVCLACEAVGGDGDGDGNGGRVVFISNLSVWQQSGNIIISSSSRGSCGSCGTIKEVASPPIAGPLSVRSWFALDVEFTNYN